MGHIKAMNAKHSKIQKQIHHEAKHEGQEHTRGKSKRRENSTQNDSSKPNAKQTYNLTQPQNKSNDSKSNQNKLADVGHERNNDVGHGAKRAVSPHADNLTRGNEQHHLSPCRYEISIIQYNIHQLHRFMNTT